MDKNMRWLCMGASFAALTLAAGCSSPELADAPPPAEVAPPPPPATQAYVAPAPSGRIETTDLLGGPASAPVHDAPPPVMVTSMEPIPNGQHYENRHHREPRDHAYQTPLYGARGSERAHVAPRHGAPNPYGHGHGQRTHHGPSGAATSHPAPVYRPAPVAAAPVAKPVAKPSGPVIATHPTTPLAPVAKPVAPPVIAPSPAPTAAPVAKIPIPPAKPLTKLEQLGAAVATDVTGGSKLTVPPELAHGKQGVVSLTLAPSLADRISAEAAKLGFTREARTVDARATLAGKGYTVIPSASQSARLKPGESTTFNWQVTPIEGEKGPLGADVGGDLKGGAKPQAFTIAAIKEVRAPAAVEEAPGSGFLDKLSLPGRPNVDVPGMGVFRSGLIVLGALGFLALVVLMAIASRVSSRRRTAERRRKFRTMTEFNSEPEAAPVNGHAPAHDEHA